MSGKIQLKLQWGKAKHPKFESYPYYIGKQEYLKAKLETCKRINAKNHNVDKKND